MRLSVAIALILAASQANAAAETVLSANATITNDDTAGGVNFLDLLSYVKPTFYSVTEPNEAGVSNKYYVDFTSGSGTTCSQGSPCADVTVVGGKAGTSGGPVVIYVKGNGYLNLTASQLAGSAGNEIVIKPWPGDSTPTVWTAAGGCNIGNANTIAGSNTHHIIFDGGPDMLIRFKGSGCTSSQNGYTTVVKSNDITLYRVRIDANDSGGPALGPATSATTANFRFINSEIYGATRYYGVYTGGGATCDASAGDNTSHTNMEFRNSIFRQIDGRGIQIEPRFGSSGIIIDGNVFHDVGYNRSGTSSISGAVQPADACLPNGQDITDGVVSNNLMWDLGGGGVMMFVDGATWEVYNNTIWDYANSSDSPTTNSHGITCSTADSCSPKVKNNIILAPAQGGLEPIHRMDSNPNTNDNVCESGSACGSGAITGTAATIFDSTSTSSSSFLKPNGNALNNCLIQTEAEFDYLLVDRGTVGGATDCGSINEP